MVATIVFTAQIFAGRDESLLDFSLANSASIWYLIF